MKLFSTLLLLLTFSCLSIGQTTTTDPFKDITSYHAPVKWRCIGPFRGGRSVAACGVVGDPLTYYSGTTGGGLWKTVDAGVSWNNISDGFFKTASVGAVSVAENDPNVIYVGMGEHAWRGVMTSSGDGMYKSTDAGKTWKHVGLNNSRHIARIVIHPKNDNIAFVAVQGALYGSSSERGIYKTTDGGATWKNVLFVDDKTGCSEISMDANNPRILYAAMWEGGRKPWKVISGGPGSGLYKSVDAGETWQKMTDGLPSDMGKMAISVCRSNSEKVYALIESDFEKDAGGLYVSNNAGKSWSQVSKNHRLIQRAWYYIELFTDPKDENLVYVLSAPALKSTDGGETWESLPGMHGDYHNLWINPNNSNNMIMSDDGGSAISFTKGATWSDLHSIPTGQFYRIDVDNMFPYNIYGGQQDYGTVKIASRNLSGGDISYQDWSRSAGGESSFLGFNPNDPRYVLGGSYQGTIDLLDTKAKTSVNVMAAPIQYLGKDAKDMKYRYDWNAPIICSVHDPRTFYHGAQLMLKTQDLGKSWVEASPDLTRNEKDKQTTPGVPYTNEAVGAENYGVLSYIKESPLERGVIYTGSNDGLVHITRDDCAKWTNITPKGLQECLINAIEVSPHDKATAYIATTRYKFNDHTPGLYKTTDYGKSWTKITNGIPDNVFTRVVREDDKRKDLLYAGTESGLYVSYNGGKDWQAFQLNLPITPITDLRVHQDNLIASTAGRAYWILDDLNLIRQYSTSKDSSFKLIKPDPNTITNSSSELDYNSEDFTGASSSGVNAPSGIVMYYQLPTLKGTEPLTLTIKDKSGTVINEFSSRSDSTFVKYDGGPRANPKLTKNRGLNRFVWNMRHSTLPGVPKVYIEGSYRGHKASPGKYTATLTTGEFTSTQEIEILPNPNYEYSASEYESYSKLMTGLEEHITSMHNLVNDLYGKQGQLKSLVKELPNDPKFITIRAELNTLIDSMKTWDEDMVQRKSTAYDDVENFPNKFTSDYLYLINQTEGDVPVITEPSLKLAEQYNAQWSVLKARGNKLLYEELPQMNNKLWELGIGAIWKR